MLLEDRLIEEALAPTLGLFPPTLQCSGSCPR
jgi:hypothetical protein